MACHPLSSLTTEAYACISCGMMCSATHFAHLSQLTPRRGLSQALGHVTLTKNRPYDYDVTAKTEEEKN